MILPACSTIQTTLGLSKGTDPAIQAVPCPSLPEIPFHTPATAAEVIEWQAGKLDDPHDQYDTPETVAAIRRLDAAVAKVCHPNFPSNPYQGPTPEPKPGR